MKKLLLILIALPMIGFGQAVTPKLNKDYITSSLGYSGCIDETTLKKIIQLSVKASAANTNSEQNSAADEFMKYHNNNDCFVLSGGLKVKVINITFGGQLVELKTNGVKASIWTVKEALREDKQ